jgi:hypothetical protein
MTYDDECRRLCTFIRQLGVGFAGVCKPYVRPVDKATRDSMPWTFFVYTQPDHVVSATGPEQPKIDKTEINRWRRAKKQAGARKAG